MSKIAFPRTMRTDDPRQLSRALDENMRYLERLLNATFNFDHDILSNVGVSDHHVKYTDAEVDAIVATHDAIVDAHHAKYTDGEVDTIVATHTALPSAHHTKYLDADAVTAMGVLGDGNALNHTKFGATGWSNWSPSYTGISIGDGTVVARYKELDDIVVGHWVFTLGSTSTVTGSPRVSTPVTVDTAYVDSRETVGTAYLFDATGLSYPAYVRLTTSLADFQLLVESASGTYTSLANINGTVPFTWAVNDIMSFAFTFEKD